ncbi:MAG: 2-dehydropantoate 2-reductase [Acidimicrobiales bacterium]
MTSIQAGKRSYAVLGTGAVGGFYGSRLAAAGHQVHFLFRGDFSHAKQEGLKVESPLGDVHIGPNELLAYDNPGDLPPCDVVLIATKALVPNPAAHLLAAMLGPGTEHTTVVTLQNGLGIEDELASFVGTRFLLGGLCFLCSNKVGPAHIRHLDYGMIALGQHGPNGQAQGITSAMEQVAEDLRAASISVQLEDDLVEARWKKLVWNAPFNSLSVVLDALPQDLIAMPETKALVAGVMAEVQAGAAAQGRHIPDVSLQTSIDLTRHMKPYRTSMKLDHDHKRPMELEAIMGNPIKAAATQGVDLPIMTTLYRQLCFIEARQYP